MRHSGRGAVLVSQSLSDFDSAGLPEHGHFTDARLRKLLKRYRFRGDALDAEVLRIRKGPRKFQDGPIYPYGWSKAQMTRLMRRIFHGWERQRLIILDEAWKYARDDIAWREFIATRCKRFELGGATA